VTDQPQASNTAPVPAGVDYSEPITVTDGGSMFPSDRPELTVAAAFAGGFLFAQILKRIAR
jgi:hypothetical protein